MLSHLIRGWYRLIDRIGRSRTAGQSPMHTALVAAAGYATERSTPVVPGDQPLSEQAVVVFDLETTGLNTSEDTVLAIGAVTVSGGGIQLGNVFESVLSTAAELDPENQLIHGLTRDDLAGGSPPRTGLLDFLSYSTDRIWVAYHASFDRIMLQRATQHWLGVDFDPDPLDLAVLAPMVFPDKGEVNAPLDHWLSVFKLDASVRHNALADAMVTAELLLIVLEQSHKLGYRTWGELERASRDWLQVQRHLAGA